VTAIDLMDRRAERHRTMRAALQEALASRTDAPGVMAMVASAAPDASLADLRTVAERAEEDLLRLVEIARRLKRWGGRTSHSQGLNARIAEAVR
jgi:hypothetical protein